MSKYNLSSKEYNFAFSRPLTTYTTTKCKYNQTNTLGVSLNKVHEELVSFPINKVSSMPTSAKFLSI